MSQVATIIRFPEEEYREYRKLALEKNKSFAKLVREALEAYRKKPNRNKKIAFKRLWKTRVTMDIPLAQLVHEGRRFENE